MDQFFPAIFILKNRIGLDEGNWFSHWKKLLHLLKSSPQVKSINQKDLLFSFHRNTDETFDFSVGVEFTGHYSWIDEDSKLIKIEFRPVKHGKRIQINGEGPFFYPRDMLPVIKENLGESREGILRLEQNTQGEAIKLRYLLDVFDKSEENKPCHLN